MTHISIPVQPVSEGATGLRQPYQTMKGSVTSAQVEAPHASTDWLELSMLILIFVGIPLWMVLS